MTATTRNQTNAIPTTAAPHGIRGRCVPYMLGRLQRNCICETDEQSPMTVSPERPKTATATDHSRANNGSGNRSQNESLLNLSLYNFSQYNLSQVQQATQNTCLRAHTHRWSLLIQSCHGFAEAGPKGSSLEHGLRAWCLMSLCFDVTV